MPQEPITPRAPPPPVPSPSGRGPNPLGERPVQVQLFEVRGTQPVPIPTIPIPGIALAEPFMRQVLGLPAQRTIPLPRITMAPTPNEATNAGVRLQQIMARQAVAPAPAAPPAVQLHPTLPKGSFVAGTVVKLESLELDAAAVPKPNIGAKEVPGGQAPFIDP